MWDSTDPYINLRAGSLTSFTGNYAITTLAPGSCTDFYYEVEVTRNSNAYNHTRRYRITATADTLGTVSTPAPREIFIEHLVSQSRNAVTNVLLDGVSVERGGTMNLMVGNTYNIKLVGSTATNGYNELESFISLPNKIFRINSVSSTYSVTSLSSPYNRLYADSCGWDNNPLSPTYRSCIVSDGKTGGTVTTNYNVTILGGAGTVATIQTLLYDFSGSSYHYNSDFSTSVRIVSISPSLNFSKSFAPVSIAANGISTLTFSLVNSSSSTVDGISFEDVLPTSPAQMRVATTPNAVNSGCGSPTISAAANATSVSFSNGSIPPGGICTFRVDVTAPTNGVYSNTSGSLSINGIDTGQTAKSNLTVAATNSGTGVCTVMGGVATWNFPTTSSTTAPLPSSNIVAATAAIGNGLTPMISSQDHTGTTGSGSWGSNGAYSTNATLTLSNNDYLEFSINTSNLNKVNLSFWAYRTQNGPQSWALYYGPDAAHLISSVTGSLSSATTWTSSGTITLTSNLNPSGSTLFRIYGYNANQSNPGADMYLDDVVFTGCNVAKPTITKSFSPPSISVNGTSALTLTLHNSNPEALTSVIFTDNLPSGLLISGTPAASQCSGTVSSTSTSISLTGGTIPANGTCNVTATVTSASAGVYQNVSGFISSAQSGTNSDSGGSASASLSVLSSPGFSKSFSQNPVYAGEASTLGFTLTNPNSTPITSVAFTDLLPSGMLVAAIPSSSNTCGATFNPIAGSTSLSLSGGTIPANGICTARVDVTSSAVGNYLNTTSALSTGIPGLTAIAATDTLAVRAHYPGIKLIKQVATSTSGPWTNFVSNIAPGSNVYYRLTVENIGDVDLSSVSVSDPNVDLSSCVLSTPFNLTSSDPIQSCTIGPVSALLGDHLNTATGQGTYLGTTYSSSSTAEYLSFIQGTGAGVTLEKQVGRSSSGPWMSSLTGVVTGNSIYYKFTITNTGDQPIGGLSINDPKIDTSGCQWIDPLNVGQSTVCFVGPFSALAGVNSNTATAQFTDPNVTSSTADTATYSAGSVSISGKVWKDMNADGIVGGGEEGLFNVILSLYLDQDNNHVYDPGIDPFLGHQYSNTSGDFTFSNIPGSSGYFVQSTGLTGYNYVSGGTNPREVQVNSADSSGNNFGYQLAAVDDAPVAVDDSNTTDEDTPVSGSVVGNDTPSGDGGNLWTKLSDPAHGSVSFTNGAYTYTPAANYNGLDSFTYQVCDVDGDCAEATVTITIAGKPTFGLAKDVTSINKVEGLAGTWDITFEFLVRNYRNIAISMLQVTDDLSSVFTTPENTFSIQSLTSSDFTINSGYDGSTDTNLLTGEDILAGDAEGKITLVVRLVPASSGPYYNTAKASGMDPEEKTIEDVSQSGVDPDPDEDGKPGNNSEPTAVTFDANIFDLPHGLKVFDSSNLPALQLTMNWINDTNIVAVNAAVSDPIPAGSVFLEYGISNGYALPAGAPAGSTNIGVTCTDTSVLTTTELCYFEGSTLAFPRGRIIWKGTLGPDLGITDPTIALNKISIQFYLRVNEGITSINNRATIDSDLNGDHDTLDAGEQQVASASALWESSTGGGDDGGEVIPPDVKATAKMNFPLIIPLTGFVPDKVTSLPVQPLGKAYTNGGDITIEITKLGVNTAVLGIPRNEKTGLWDVSWLWNQVGWLNGTAYPTWDGNSVLTAHVYLPNGKPGPFVNLGKLQWGDQIIIYSLGQKYVYEVREVKRVLPDNQTVFKHEDRSWLTLVTCEGYDDKSGEYAYRRVVRAVLVEVK